MTNFIHVVLGALIGSFIGYFLSHLMIDFLRKK